MLFRIGRGVLRRIRQNGDLVMKRIVMAAMMLGACSPAAPDAPPPRLPVPIRGADSMSLIRGAALDLLVRGSVQTRQAPPNGVAPVETFAATGDAYTLRYDKPDSTGRYRITPDRVCLTFPADRSVYCRFYLKDRAGKTWIAEDDRDYPLHIAAVSVTRG